VRSVALLISLATALLMGWILWIHIDINNHLSVSFGKPTISLDDQDPTRASGMRILLNMDIGNSGSLDMDILDGSYTISVYIMTSEGIPEDRGVVKAYSIEIEPIHLSPGIIKSVPRNVFMAWDSLVDPNAAGVIIDYFSRKEPYDHLGLVIEGNVEAQASFYKTNYPFSVHFDYESVHDNYPKVEKVEIRGSYVVKNGTDYVVTINLVNTGTVATSIDTIYINDVPHDDVGWSGEIWLGGNFYPLPSLCEIGITKTGSITFTQDIQDLSGNRLSSGVTLIITLHTTGGIGYKTSVLLP